VLRRVLGAYWVMKSWNVHLGETPIIDPKKVFFATSFYSAGTTGGWGWGNLVGPMPPLTPWSQLVLSHHGVYSFSIVLKLTRTIEYEHHYHKKLVTCNFLLAAKTVRGGAHSQSTNILFGVSV
jgi:hypothetical protein